MVVHAEVPVAVVEAGVAPALAGDVEGGALPAPAVAAGLLSGFEGRDHPVAQVSLCLFEGLGHGLHDLGAREDVALAAKMFPDDVAGPGHAFLPGEAGGAALGVDDPELAAGPAGVGLGQGLHHLLGALSLGEEGEALGTVAGVGEGLGGDGAGAGLDPGDYGAHGDELGLDGYPPLPGLGVVGHDGEGRHGREWVSRLLGEWVSRLLFRLRGERGRRVVPGPSTRESTGA